MDFSLVTARTHKQHIAGGSADMHAHAHMYTHHSITMDIMGTIVTILGIIVGSIVGHIRIKCGQHHGHNRERNDHNPHQSRQHHGHHVRAHTHSCH